MSGRFRNLKILCKWYTALICIPDEQMLICIPDDGTQSRELGCLRLCCWGSPAPVHGGLGAPGPRLQLAGPHSHTAKHTSGAAACHWEQSRRTTPGTAPALESLLQLSKPSCSKNPSQREWRAQPANSPEPGLSSLSVPASGQDQLQPPGTFSPLSAPGQG